MRKFLGVALAALCITSTAEAVYESSSDTSTEFFDYIENRRREIREQQLTEEQQKLLDDIAEAKEQLPHEQKEGEPTPAVFEGDDLVYYSGSGEFIATGKVDIIQLDASASRTKRTSCNSCPVRRASRLTATKPFTTTARKPAPWATLTAKPANII